MVGHPAMTLRWRDGEWEAVPRLWPSRGQPLLDEVAVFSEPDGQVLWDQCESFEKFRAAASLVIGKPRVAVEPYDWQVTIGTSRTAAGFFHQGCKDRRRDARLAHHRRFWRDDRFDLDG